MKKQSKTKKRYFVYPHINVKGEKELMTIRPGDEVIVNGKRITATIEYINELYSICYQDQYNEMAYTNCKDILFESKKNKYACSNDDYDCDPIETLPDLRHYSTYKANGRSGLFMEKGDLSNYLCEPLSILEEIKQELSPTQLKLIYDLYERNLGLTELAEERGTSRQAIWGQNDRLKKTLKRLFAKHGIDDSFFDNL